MTTTRPREEDTVEAAAPRRRMVAGGAVLSAAMVGAGVGNYVVNAAAARLLGPAAFGDASVLISVLLLLAAVAGCLQLVTARQVAKRTDGNGADGDRAAIGDLERIAWWTGGVLSLGMVLGAPAITSALALASAAPVVVLALGVPWYLGQAVERGVLQGRLAFGPLAVTFLVETVVRCAATVALLVAGAGVVGVGVGLSASFVATYGSARWANRRVIRAGDAPISGARVRQEIAGMSVMLVAQIAATNADLFVVKALADGVDAGRYAAVAVLGRAVFFCSWSVVTALFPFSAAAATERELRTIRRGGLTVLAVGGVFATVGVVLGGSFALRAVFGAGYGEVAALLMPYVAATSCFTAANFLASTAAARGDLHPARVLLLGSAAQTAAVAAVGSDIMAAAWVQLPAMALTLGAILGTTSGRSSARRQSAVTPGQ